MSDAQKAIEYAHQNRERFSRELTEFIRIESVSTDDEYKPQVLKAAEWAADHLRKIGIENVALIPTGGHPVVYGDWLKRPGAPTVLIYGHYDVQPVDPIELWETSPFEATVKGDYLFGRGTSDMKGQVMATLNAIEAIMKTGDFPVNLVQLRESGTTQDRLYSFGDHGPLRIQVAADGGFVEQELAKSLVHGVER